MISCLIYQVKSTIDFYFVECISTRIFVSKLHHTSTVCILLQIRAVETFMCASRKIALWKDWRIASQALQPSFFTSLQQT
jgi:hypothetical protein